MKKNQIFQIIEIQKKSILAWWILTRFSRRHELIFVHLDKPPPPLTRGWLSVAQTFLQQIRKINICLPIFKTLLMDSSRTHRHVHIEIKDKPFPAYSCVSLSKPSRAPYMKNPQRDKPKKRQLCFFYILFIGFLTLNEEVAKSRQEPWRVDWIMYFCVSRFLTSNWKNRKKTTPKFFSRNCEKNLEFDVCFESWWDDWPNSLPLFRLDVANVLTNMT